MAVAVPLKATLSEGKIALLEAIRAKGLITAAARHVDMSYRRAWLLVEQTNEALRKPAVSAAPRGRHGGGTVLTPIGEQVIELYRSTTQLRD